MSTDNNVTVFSIGECGHRPFADLEASSGLRQGASGGGGVRGGEGGPVFASAA
jgi:hypothetical protein